MEVIEIKNRWSGALLYSGEQANIHAQHYIEALAFAKRLLKDLL